MTNRRGNRAVGILAAVAVALGLAAGSYGIASAASGTGTTPSTGSLPAAPVAPDAQHPWGGQRSDETPLTGDALAQVKAAALGKLPGATIVRIETDADGHAAYEAHMVKADRTLATVYVDKQFNAVGVETR